MNRETRLARANEIFARVWPEDRDDTLYDVAYDVMIDLDDMAGDLTTNLVALDNLASRLDDAQDEEDLREQIKAVRFWVDHTRKMAERVKHALAVTDELERQSA